MKFGYVSFSDFAEHFPTDVFKYVFYLLFMFVDIEVFAIWGVAVLIDSFMGIAVTWKVDGRRSVSSKKFWFGILVKVVTMAIGLIVGFLLLKLDKKNWANYFVDTYLWMLLAQEVISIIEHRKMYKTGERIKRWDYISTLLIAFRQALGHQIERFIEGMKKTGGCDEKDESVN